MDTIQCHRRPTRALQPLSARRQQRPRLRVRAPDARGEGPGHIVRGIGVAAGREEQRVGLAVRSAAKGRRFDQRAVGVAAVKDLNGVAGGLDCVGAERDEHDGRGVDGRDGVAADTTVAEAVAVNLIQQVVSAVGVAEARSVDGAAGVTRGRVDDGRDVGVLSCWVRTNKRHVVRSVRPCHTRVGGRDADTMSGVGGQRGREVEDVNAIVLCLELVELFEILLLWHSYSCCYMWSPDLRVCLIYPSWEAR